MKKILIPLACVAILFTACEKTGTPSVSDIPDATRGDSLMFYYGQNVAAEYWMGANADTAFRSKESRKEFLRGFKEGLSDVRDNDAYNRGLYTALGVAMNIRTMKQQYPDVKFDDHVLIDALIAALENDSVADASQVKADFYRVTDAMVRDREKADRVTATKALEKTAAKLGMTRLGDNLYGKTITAGYGPQIKNGDMVMVDISAATVKGELVGMQLPDHMVVGRNYSSPLFSEALLTMKEGETRQFIASPIDLMPRRYRQGEYKCDNLIKITIKVIKVTSGGSDSPVETPEQ